MYLLLSGPREKNPPVTRNTIITISVLGLQSRELWNYANWKPEQRGYLLVKGLPQL